MTRQSPFYSAFPGFAGKRHVILPVIHVTGIGQALRNTAIAQEAGSDGVFLINHSIAWPELLLVHRQVAAAFPGWWIGVNCLDLDPHDVFFHLAPAVAGVWTDNAMIRETEEAQPDAEHAMEARRRSGWSGLYFGGVAFKYQRHVTDLRRACRIAREYMDVVTTSGPGTGSAAAPDKIFEMKQALGSHPLAIASGITPENVHQYTAAADCFLVATGISKTFEELDPARVRALVEAVRQ